MSTRDPTKPDTPADVCPVPVPRDLSGVREQRLSPQPPLSDYLAAMQLANREARTLLGEAMLLSWYDRDRNFEAPQHVSECHQDSAVPGYIDYALNRGATLRVDIEDGRFVFFYRKADL
jgi:hypothetical protein